MLTIRRAKKSWDWGLGNVPVPLNVRRWSCNSSSQSKTNRKIDLIEQVVQVSRWRGSSVIDGSALALPMFSPSLLYFQLLESTLNSCCC
jgi:hypothetical protein